VKINDSKRKQHSAKEEIKGNGGGATQKVNRQNSDDSDASSRAEDTIEILLEKASRKYSEESYGEALSYLELALAKQKRSLPPTNPDIASSLENMAQIKIKLRRYDEAFDMASQALDLRKAATSPTDVSVAHTLDIMAQIRCGQDDYERAIPLFNDAINIKKKVLGRKHRSLASTINNLALVKDRQVG